MLDSLLEAVLDSLKLLPFLFLTYLLMELLEYKAGEKSEQLLQKAGRFGPVLGGLIGAFPQCGFSAAASSFYAGRIITVGTLLAVFLSTSDEMLPIFISENVPVLVILKILGTKVLIAAVSGFAAELVYNRLLHRRKKHMDIHGFCEQEDCNCEDNLFVSALKHTLKIFAFILVISVAIELLITVIGEDTLTAVFTGVPVVGQLVAALVGLIPNCAASVIITELYLQNIISAGAMMSGLLVGAGVGLLILFRLNHNLKENLAITGVLYATGVFWGVMIDLVGLTF